MGTLCACNSSARAAAKPWSGSQKSAFRCSDTFEVMPSFSALRMPEEPTLNSIKFCHEMAVELRRCLESRQGCPHRPLRMGQSSLSESHPCIKPAPLPDPIAMPRTRVRRFVDRQGRNERNRSPLNAARAGPKERPPSGSRKRRLSERNAISLLTTHADGRPLYAPRLIAGRKPPGDSRRNGRNMGLDYAGGRALSATGKLQGPIPLCRVHLVLRNGNGFGVQLETQPRPIGFNPWNDHYVILLTVIKKASRQV